MAADVTWGFESGCRWLALCTCAANSHDKPCSATGTQNSHRQIHSDDSKCSNPAMLPMEASFVILLQLSYLVVTMQPLDVPQANGRIV